jgi:hypothetical protein
MHVSTNQIPSQGCQPIADVARMQVRFPRDEMRRSRCRKKQLSKEGPASNGASSLLGAAHHTCDGGGNVEYDNAPVITGIQWRTSGGEWISDARRGA